ncbi:hypothetical protein FHR81_000070 [Actinoalloteichus hoggarensis]|uniref:Uncharacterized protein n=1 Tax=Actinoalloteichus hoggarensis TaxID=1470176 RepID=A0A221W384_9PSEU|nr:hypothetical protein [Actinoalloteichus hoggarensis]ASO20245.1 hypothetical protein AHOG_13010 [Actinoalloteichus hoggarensis]MBB5919041.1 hypothetical protein [Actinoalloteichus hoggarensis]
MGRGARRRRAARRRREAPAKPEWRRWWTWASVALIPTVLTVGGVWLGATISLNQAGELEARAQQGAERVEDARLAAEPAVTARVRPVGVSPQTWVFPDVLDRATLARTYDRVQDDRVREFGSWGAVLSDSELVAVGDVYKTRSSFHVTLVGNRREPVRVVAARAVVVERSAPLDGTVLHEIPQGVGAVEDVFVDLDDPSGALRYVEDGSGDQARPWLDVRSVSLEQGEAVDLEVSTLTSEHRYLWRLELTVDYGSTRGETVLIGADGTADGKPIESNAWSPGKPGVDGVAAKEMFHYRGGIHHVYGDEWSFSGPG